MTNRDVGGSNQSCRLTAKLAILINTLRGCAAPLHTWSRRSQTLPTGGQKILRSARVPLDQHESQRRTAFPASRLGDSLTRNRGPERSDSRRRTGVRGRPDRRLSPPYSDTSAENDLCELAATCQPSDVSADSLGTSVLKREPSISITNTVTEVPKRLLPRARPTGTLATVVRAVLAERYGCAGMLGFSVGRGTCVDSGHHARTHARTGGTPATTAAVTT